MRWKGQRESDNVVDRRDPSAEYTSAGQSGADYSRPRSGTRSLTLGGVVLAVVLSYLTGRNPLELLSLLSSTAVVSPDQRASYDSGFRPATAQEDESKRFLSVVLANTEDVWRSVFQQQGKVYSDPSLVIFTDAVDSACGFNRSATGPFYCPGDQSLYIDIGFLGQLQSSLGANGDFAAAYVIAHEVGHHIQTLLGIESRVRRKQSESASPNLIQVSMELQADCLAGVWGSFAEKQGLLEVGDVEEGINAAKAVGDDRIQAMNRQAVNPDSFTHGSSAERARWFKRGFESGDITACDTFS